MKLDSNAFLYSGIKSVFVRATEGQDGKSTAALFAEKVDANTFIEADGENLEFYRGKVSAKFGHNRANAEVRLEDGGVDLTGVSGTIMADGTEVTVPDGASVSIKTDGKIRIDSPITVGEKNFPYGVIIHPNGELEEIVPPPAPPAPPTEPEEPEVPEIPDVPEADDDDDDDDDDDAVPAPVLAGEDEGVEIGDQAVPLAVGPVTCAQFVDYLWRHEGSPVSEASAFADVPADYEFAQAIGWAQASGLITADEDGNFQPEELVTVEAVREILANFARVFGKNAVEAAALTTLTGDDGEAVLNCDEVLAEFFGEEYVSPVDESELNPEVETAA